MLTNTEVFMESISQTLLDTTLPGQPVWSDGVEDYPYRPQKKSRGGRKSRQAYQKKRVEKFREEKGLETMAKLYQSIYDELHVDPPTFFGSFDPDHEDHCQWCFEREGVIKGFSAMSLHVTDEDSTINCATSDICNGPMVEKSCVFAEDDYIGSIVSHPVMDDKKGQLPEEKALVLDDGTCSTCQQQSHVDSEPCTMSTRIEPTKMGTNSTPQLQELKRVSLPVDKKKLRPNWRVPEISVKTPKAEFSFYHSPSPSVHDAHFSILYPPVSEHEDLDVWIQVLHLLDCRSRFKIFSNVPHLAHLYMRQWGVEKCTCKKRCATVQEGRTRVRRYCMQLECCLLGSMTVIDYLRYVEYRKRTQLRPSGRAVVRYPPLRSLLLSVK